MKFNYKGRGFVVVTLAAMLVVVGTVNYQLSRKSLLETSKEFTAYEQAQNEKNTDTDGKEEVKVVDSKENKVEEKVTEASKQIEKQLTSEKNMKKATYILDMKMTREKQRNSLTQDLNEMINNPSTSEEARKEVDNLLKVSFKPEFLNRVDDIIMFKPLSESGITKIIDIFVGEVANRLKDRNITLEE